MTFGQFRGHEKNFLIGWYDFEVDLLYRKNKEEMDIERLAYLLFLHCIGRLSEQEAAELRHWLGASSRYQDWVNNVLDRKRIRKSQAVRELFDEEQAWGRLAVRLHASRRRKTFFATWMGRVAAIILVLVVGVGGYWLICRGVSAESNVVADMPSIEAAKRGVILSYNNHEQNLSSTEFVVSDTINAVLPDKPDELLTIRVERGNLFRIILDDSTEVYLNSDTKLTFPRRFVQQSRDVTLWYGEAYFRVKRQEERPFFVHVCDSKVRVLGTTFNVNAYADEYRVTTTLVEGSVSFHSKNDKDFILKPGMQSLMDIQSGETKVKCVDTSLYTSWIEGKLIFQSMDLPSIMRQIERWYDIKVDYRVAVNTNYHFRGMIDKSLDLSQVLDILEQVTELTFTVEGRTVIVSR